MKNTIIFGGLIGLGLLKSLSIAKVIPTKPSLLTIAPSQPVLVKVDKNDNLHMRIHATSAWLLTVDSSGVDAQNKIQVGIDGKEPQLLKEGPNALVSGSPLNSDVDVAIVGSSGQLAFHLIAQY